MHLRMVLETLRQHQLYAKLSKCEFWLSEVMFLGHIISREGIKVDPAKVEAVNSWVRPKNVSKFRCLFAWQGIIEGLFRISRRLLHP